MWTTPCPPLSSPALSYLCSVPRTDSLRLLGAFLVTSSAGPGHPSPQPKPKHVPSTTPQRSLRRTTQGTSGCLPHQACPGSGGGVARGETPSPPGLYQGSLQEEYGCNALDLVGGQPAVPAAAAEAALGLRVQVELGAEDAVLPACLLLSQAGVVLWGERRCPLTRRGCGCGWVPSAGPPPALRSPRSLPGRPLTSCRKERVSCSRLSRPWSR